MHPDMGDGGTVVGAFALGDFVFVMREHQVYAATMNVKSLAQILARHRTAFDMPAGTAPAPG